MLYGDFLAFPFPQDQLFAHREHLEFDPELCLDLFHATSAPPNARKMTDIIRHHTWFLEQVGRQTGYAKEGCFFGLQHPPDNVTADDIMVLAGIGVRFMTIAYLGENEYGGAFDRPHTPLSPRGELLLEAMSTGRMVLDLSHAGHRTAREALGYIAKRQLPLRVVATHTACFSRFDHPRALPDDILRGIAELGGLVGLVTVTWMLHESDNSMRPFHEHLEHLMALVGTSHVCLGTDGVYRRLNPEEERKRFELMKDKLDPSGIFRARYPEQPEKLNTPQRLLVIEEELGLRGYSSSSIKKILGENLAQFLSRI